MSGMSAARRLLTIELADQGVDFDVLVLGWRAEGLSWDECSWRLLSEFGQRVSRDTLRRYFAEAES